MYKRLIVNVTCLILPLIIIILFVNIKVDSGFIINNRSEEIAKILVSGGNVAIKNIPSSLGSLQVAVVKENLKSKRTVPKDILVFGTSRSAEINATIFPDKSFFNCALPGGNILDYIALYGLYKQARILPKYLIISIDPWTFHSRKPLAVNKWMQYIADPSTPLRVNDDLIDEYYNGTKFLGFKSNTDFKKVGKTFSVDKIIELFSPNYFQINLPLVFYKTVSEIRTEKDNVNSFSVIRSDGGYSLAQQPQNDSAFVKNKSFELVEVQRSTFFIASDIRTVYWSHFKQLLLSLKKDGVIPIVYISPVNPIVFDNLSHSSKLVLEESIDTFCKENSIQRVGSFDPHKYGYNTLSNSFMDAYHPVKSVIENIFYFHRDELSALGIVISNDKNTR